MLTVGRACFKSKFSLSPSLCFSLSILHMPVSIPVGQLSFIPVLKVKKQGKRV